MDVTDQMLEDCFKSDPWYAPAGLMRANTNKVQIRFITRYDIKEIDYFAITKGVIEE